MPLPVGVDQRWDQNLSELSLLSLNVDELTIDKAHLLHGWLDSFDLIVLQEVGKRPSQHNLDASLPQHVVYVANVAQGTSPRGKGLMLLSRRTFITLAHM